MKVNNEIRGLGSAAQILPRSEITGTTNVSIATPNGQLVSRSATNSRNVVETRCAALGGIIATGTGQSLKEEEIPIGDGFAVFIRTTSDDQSAYNAILESIELAREACGGCDPDRSKCTPPEERTDV